MAEQPKEQPEVVEAEIITAPEQTTVTPEANLEEGYVIPKGTIAFSILMIIGYAFYFFMIWSEVIARAGGQ